MQRGGQECWFQDGLPSARLDEGHAIEPANFIFDADGFVERQQICAGAEQDVLAVVHDFAGAGMFVGGGASAEVGAAFEDGDLKAAASKGARGGNSGESASDDGYCGGTVRHQTIRCNNPLPRMVSFSRVVRLTLRVKTS